MWCLGLVVGPEKLKVFPCGLRNEKAQLLFGQYYFSQLLRLTATLGAHATFFICTFTKGRGV